MILNGIIFVILSYSTEFDSFGVDYVNVGVVEDRLILYATKMSSKLSSLSNI